MTAAASQNPTIRRAVSAALAAVVALGASLVVVAEPVTRTYREAAGSVRNPGQGWTTTRTEYARYARFLSVGAIYNRYDWAKLEPEEGRYDWSVLERDLDFAAKQGIPAAFRVMCANSGARQAVTPDWVWKAGARHHVCESISYSGTVVTNSTPVFEDEVFQRLHRRFLTALAAKFDGDPRLAGIDLGSYGNWGEWHCGRLPPAVPSRLDPEFLEAARQVRVGTSEGLELYHRVQTANGKKRHPPAERLDREGMKTYVDMYLDNFRRTDIVFMTDGAEVLDYAIGDGPVPRVGLRRDGIGLRGHFKRWIGSPAYAHVKRMGDVWRSKPVWFEGWHTCDRIISDGEDLFDMSIAFMLTNHVSLVNSFPIRPEQVKDDPRHSALVSEINLRAGARLVPVSATVERHGNRFALCLTGENKGVSKIYLDYVATVEARTADGRTLAGVDLRTDVRSWLPGRFELNETAEWPIAVPEDARLVLRLRHRAKALGDFRFAADGLTDDGALPL